MIKKRLAALRALFEEKDLDAVLVTKIPNLYYFSGFRGDDTVLLITKAKAYLVTDSRYTEQAAAEAPLYELVEQKTGLLMQTAALAKSLNLKNVGFEGADMSYETHARLTKLMDGIRLTEALRLDSLREIKDEGEIENIRKACEIADIAFKDVCTFIHAGVTEIEVAARLEEVMRRAGSEKPSFDTIVASGLRGSMPHGTATQKPIEAGDFVTMDFGAKYQGYCSDITRTVVVGKASERQREVYAAVLETQKNVLDAIAPGKSGRKIDALARDNLKRYDLAQYFGHGLGHSLGLEIHEEPRLSRYSTCESLVPGMLVTDEPGVYLPDWGGLRIEDTVLVTKDGAEPLTKCSKELIELN